MVNFVLVHGAMHGGWCWKNVRSILAKAGYSVLTPTLNVTDVAGGLSIYFHPEALLAFSELAQKLPSTSFIPENLFPSISARHDVMDGTGKFNSRSRVTLPCNHATVISQRLTPSDILYSEKELSYLFGILPEIGEGMNNNPV